ncbi:hypothetical protein ES703_97205 [subsurface metagenome]
MNLRVSGNQVSINVNIMANVVEVHPVVIGQLVILYIDRAGAFYPIDSDCFLIGYTGNDVVLNLRAIGIGSIIAEELSGCVRADENGLTTVTRNSTRTLQIGYRVWVS